MYDIYIRGVALPFAVKAVVLPNDDGTFDIYVNSALSEESQEKALAHELAHIKKNHFYNAEPVVINEKEAG